MSAVGYDVWGAVNGAVSIVAVFIALTNWILSWRPSAMVHLLHQYLKQTEGEFNTAVSDGLLHGGSGVWLRFRFWALQIRADDIRSQVYDIHTWGEELSSWWKGTSSTMSIICNDLTKLRAALAKCNSRERREIASSSYPNRLAHWLGLRDRLFMTSPESTVSSTPFEKSDLPLPHTPTILAGTSLMLGLAPILPTAGIPGVHGGAETHNHPCLGPKASAHSAILPPATPAYRCAEKGTKIGDKPHYLVSDKDLKVLLSYVAARPPQGGRDGDKRKRASRKELLLRYGRQLFGPDAPASGWFPEPFPTAVPTKRRAARSRFGAIRRLMRSTLSRMCTQSAADVATVDLESSRPQHAEADDCDEEDDWCDA